MDNKSGRKKVMLGLGVRAKIVAKFIFSGAEPQAPLFTSSLLG